MNPDLYSSGIVGSQRSFCGSFLFRKCHISSSYVALWEWTRDHSHEIDSSSIPAVMADSVFNNLLGSQLLKGDDTVETTKRVGGEGKVLGLYFSAHWCPPCRGFTPKLAEFYNNFRASNGDKLEIVFVSSDRSEKDFKDYFKEMPWLALSFAERERKVRQLLHDVFIYQAPLLSCLL